MGYGGARGKPLIERDGPYLPGGTIDGTQKSDRVTQEQILATLIKEIAEEYGKKREAVLRGAIKERVSDEHLYDFESDGYSVYIVYVPIEEALVDLIEGAVDDGISTSYDQCFKAVKREHISIVLSKMEQEETKNWFVTALKEMNKRYFSD